MERGLGRRARERTGVGRPDSRPSLNVGLSLVDPAVSPAEQDHPWARARQCNESPASTTVAGRAGAAGAAGEGRAHAKFPAAA